MTSERLRRCAAEVAIGLLLCGAVQMFVIGPAQRRLDAVRAECDRAAAPSETTAALSATHLTQLTSIADQQAAQVRERSRIAESETDLFSTLMAIAERTGVRIDQLEPGTPVTATAAPPVPAADPAAAPVEPPPRDGAVAYSMSISATYGRLRRFLSELRRGAGFVVVRSVRIEPGDAEGRQARGWTADEGPAIRATVVSEHHWFDLSRLEQTLSPAPATGAGEAMGSVHR